jgi:hypothetical protein
MPSCEKCWRDAGGNPLRYHLLLDQRDCTPEEQAGEDAKICPKCKRKAIHQFSKICMNPDCKEEVKP